VRECGVEFFQNLKGFLLAGGGQVRVNDRGVQRGVAQCWNKPAVVRIM